MPKYPFGVIPTARGLPSNCTPALLDRLPPAPILVDAAELSVRSAPGVLRSVNSKRDMLVAVRRGNAPAHADGPRADTNVGRVVVGEAEMLAALSMGLADVGVAAVEGARPAQKRRGEFERRERESERGADAAAVENTFKPRTAVNRLDDPPALASRRIHERALKRMDQWRVRAVVLGGGMH